MVHLPFLVGQLAGGTRGFFINHQGGDDFQVACLGRLIQEEGDQRPFQFSAFTPVNGEA